MKIFSRLSAAVLSVAAVREAVDLTEVAQVEESPAEEVMVAVAQVAVER